MMDLLVAHAPQTNLASMFNPGMPRSTVLGIFPPLCLAEHFAGESPTMVLAS
jgi:hypothetical protein